MTVLPGLALENKLVEQNKVVVAVFAHLCRSVVAYKTTIMPIHSMPSIVEGGKLSMYDSVDEEVLRSYREYSLASLIFYAMKESSCSEQSQRMTAMDAATKNAGRLLVLL